VTRDIALVPARGGSRRIPRKNLKGFLGVPAIARVIAMLQHSEIFDRIVVSTEDQEIAGVARDAGADVPGVRPDHLADDHATTTEVVRHAIETWLEDVGEDARLWAVYPTAVLLTCETLCEASAMFEAADADFLIPVLRYAHPVERRLRVAAGGLLIPDELVALRARSQDLEPAFHDSGQFYVGTIQAWQQFTPLTSGRNRAFELPAGSAVDIDEPAHWALAERLALEGNS
jgi:pseudaminic acid cytidylyltransferase